MGVVYLARSGDAVAAVKVVSAGLAADEGFRSRFRREIEVCGRVSGPQVARLLDADPDGLLPWLAMEYVPGPTLDQVVTSVGPLTGPALREFAVAVTEALAQIHSVGVTHRDLKPSNVILTPATPVVIDFGIAAATDATCLTRTGLGLGSAGWTPPEQILGHPAGPPADVFAWGATVAYAATGRPPFGVGRADAVAYRVIHGQPDLDGVPPDLAPAVARALERQASRRPTVADLIGSLTGDANPRALIGATWVDPGPSMATAVQLPIVAAAPAPSPSPSPHPSVHHKPPRRPGRFRRRGLLIGVLSAIAITLAVALSLVVGQSSRAADHTRQQSTPPAAAPTTAPPTTMAPATSTTVAAERISPDIALFEGAISALTPFANDLAQYTGTDDISAPENEAGLLGSWYALADWCSNGQHGRPGVCYDKAAAFLDNYMGRDPRTINTATWGAPGAIGGVIADTYDLTKSYLGISSNVMIPELTPRPGESILCEPSCTAVIDSSPSTAAAPWPSALDWLGDGENAYAVYLSLERGAVPTAESHQAISDARSAGYEPYAGDIGCALGAREALNLDPSYGYFGVALYFANKSEAQRFVDLYSPGVVGTVAVTGCYGD
jgi:serine/threonine protein kinase